MIELHVAKNAYVDDTLQERRDEEKIKSPSTFPMIPKQTKIQHSTLIIRVCNDEEGDS